LSIADLRNGSLAFGVVHHPYVIRFWGGTARYKLWLDAEPGDTKSYLRELGRITINEFQDHLLRPLGHPSGVEVDIDYFNWKRGKFLSKASPMDNLKRK